MIKFEYMAEEQLVCLNICKEDNMLQLLFKF